MARALSEYVLAAVLRVFPGFDRYALQQRATLRQPLTVRERAGFRVGVPGGWLAHGAQ